MPSARSILTLTVSVATLSLAAHGKVGGTEIQPALVSVEPALNPAVEPRSGALPLATELDASPARVEYGAEGSRWWIITTGWGHGITSQESEEGDDINLAGAFSYFIVKDVEVNAELGAWYHDQNVDDAISGNLSLVFRWHFYNNNDWTIYADLGVGALVASDEVPQEGTNFAFTPRAGVGFTKRLGDCDTRLIVGLRWQHFSNARVFGDDDNPGRDDVMVYAGVVFPF